MVIQWNTDGIYMVNTMDSNKRKRAIKPQKDMEEP